MLPRQRRAGVATDGARRERMRPWQRPESGRRTWCSVNGPRASAPKATEVRIPRVGFPHTPRRNGLDPATAGTPPGGRSGCPRIRRPNPVRPATSGQFQEAPEPFSLYIMAVYTPFVPVRSALPQDLRHTRPGPGRTREGPGKGSAVALGPPWAAGAAPAARQVREAWSAPRTGPPPAGNEATVFPQPAVSSAAGRPTQHPCKRSRWGRARAHGRAHGHTPGARADTPDRAPTEGPGGRTGRAPGALRRSGPGWSAGDRRAGTTPPRRLAGPLPTASTALPGRRPGDLRARAREGLHRPSPTPPRSLRASSALPSRGVRLPLTRPAPSVTRAARLPAVPRVWPVRTTIPPYGRPALNGRDAANYAGFTDVLSRAAYSSGLGQMRVRPECRGSSLGRTRYECRAPHR